MNKYILWIFLIILVIVVCLLLFFFTGKKALADNIAWGVNFSQNKQVT
jgi:preprotein translocase subunit SecF